METQDSVAAWTTVTFGSPEPIVAAARANEEMAELLTAVAKTKPDDYVAEEMADVVIVLYQLASTMGLDLHEAIDQKMRKNRARKWIADGTGVGRHV